MVSTPQGSVRFGSLVIEYDDRVLRPRPWTARQSRWAADLLTTVPPGPVLELCSGAGQIGLLTVVATTRQLVAVDVTPAACELTRRNAVRAGVADRVEVREGELDAVIGAEEHFALVVADPPYLRPHEADGYPDDPRVAIDGGRDGMDLVWRCVAVIGDHLLPGGAAILQLRSTDQADRVREHLAESGDLTVTECRDHGRGVLVLILRGVGRAGADGGSRRTTAACRSDRSDTQR